MASPEKVRDARKRLAYWQGDSHRGWDGLRQDSGWNNVTLMRVLAGRCGQCQHLTIGFGMRTVSLDCEKGNSPCDSYRSLPLGATFRCFGFHVYDPKRPKIEDYLRSPYGFSLEEVARGLSFLRA